ncbi:MAG: hypothetical protein H7Z12_04555 [Rhodospirillaceae bacterium]|nr:hypothetical protein [Rhodospirillales bacterium]
MTSIRRSISFAALAGALALSVTSTAQAGEFKDKGQHMTGGIPLVTSNSVTANNTAAGIGNKADQSVYADQSGAQGWRGKGYGGGYTDNSTNATNLAAGYKNHATQDVMTRQSGSPGALTLNRVDAMNMAVGEHNFANQRVMTKQR